MRAHLPHPGRAQEVRGSSEPKRTLEVRPRICLWHLGLCELTVGHTSWIITFTWTEVQERQAGPAEGESKDFLIQSICANCSCELSKGSSWVNSHNSTFSVTSILDQSFYLPFMLNLFCLWFLTDPELILYLHCLLLVL